MSGGKDIKILIVAEKPSVTKDLMKALDPSAKAYGGYYESEKYIFTNAIGHLLRLKNPEEINSIYKSWKLETLPIRIHNKIISNYMVNEKTKKQMEVVEQLFKREDIKYIVNAADPDREGELIFSTMYSYLKCTKECQRLLLKDMTLEGIREQFALLEPGEKFDGLKASAYARAISDYLVGMNMTRALSCKYGRGSVLSSGRVQTPTLKLIYDRTKENKSHKKVVHYVIKAKLKDSEIVLDLEDLKFNEEQKALDLVSKLPENLEVLMSKKNKSKTPPPLPHLLDIQKIANNKWGYKAEETLNIVQALYEKYKAVSYPRTDCNFITENTANKLNGKLDCFKTFSKFKEIDHQKINKKTIGKVTAHEAITPTGVIPNYKTMREQESNVYLEIVNIFLANFCKNYQYKDVIYTATHEEYKFKGTEKELVDEGYLKVYRNVNHKYKDILPSGTYPVEYSVVEVESKPKPLFTEATLIMKMENIHNEEEGGVKKILKEVKGIGTPATRGSIIATLFSREYIENKGKSLITTEKGNKLIELLMSINSKLLDVKYTADLENVLKEMTNNKSAFKNFLEEVNILAAEMVKEIKETNSEIEFQGKAPGGKTREELCPKCENKLVETEKVVFCSKKNDNCDFVIFKKVAGKSLTKEQIAKLITKGETEEIVGFKSKAGKQFNASLKLDEKSKGVTFVFKN